MASEKLQATPTKDAGGNISWKLCDAKVPTDCGTLGSNPVTALPHSFFPKTYNFEITVTNDQTGLGIVFAPDPPSPPGKDDGPLWIQANTKPSEFATDSHISSQSGGGTTSLKFQDKNKGSAVDLQYRLNFVDSAGKKVTSIDPEIKNGGSTISFASSATVAIIGGVVLLALLITGVRALIRRGG